MYPPSRRMYLTQIKPLAPKLNVLIKLHKDNEPIRPVVNNTQTPPYKLSKFLKQWLSETLQLPNNFMVHNSVQLANELHNINLEETYKRITFDVKDLCVNIPIEEVIITMKSLLRNKKLYNSLIQQTILLLRTILSQNYCQFDDNSYQPNKGVTMGSPISSLIAEIFLQFHEDRIIKHNLESIKIIFTINMSMTF
jgi:hypothetical protein